MSTHMRPLEYLKQKSKKRSSSGAFKQSGFSIIAALFLMVALGILGVFMVTLSTVQHATSSTAINAGRAYQAARSGIEWGVDRAANAGICNPGPTAVDMTSAPGLANFAVNVVCTQTLHQEGANPVTVFDITSTSTDNTFAFGEPYFVSRQIRVTATNAP